MIVSFTCLHYGSDYLGYAIKSIYDSVDKVLIAYSPTPSHGHDSHLRNPDSRDDCRNAAFQFGDPQNKIHWVEGKWNQEGKHRDMAFALYPDADLISVLDADEVWHPHEFANAIEWCRKNPAHNYKQRLRTPWRSFNWICDDNMMPDRFYNPKSRAPNLYIPGEVATYYHFGYAREPKHIEYKLSCHGHKNEMNDRWFTDTFMRWSPTNNIPNLHPTCDQTWFAKPFDKLLLPEVMRSHPYWDRELI